MNYPWSKDIDWKLHSKDEKIYIMRDHNWAFAAWEIAKLEGRIHEKSLVVHVDSHLDEVADGILVKGLFEANTKEEIIRVSRSYDRSMGQVPESNIMHIDNFIWASLGKGTIEEVIFVSRDKQELNTLSDLNEFYLKKLPIGCNYKTQLYRDSEEFLRAYDKDAFSKYLGSRTVILDLDIDAFNNSDTMWESDLLPEHKIRDYVRSLKDLYSWDLITIAISPDYCGGTDEASYLLDIVINELGVDLDNFEKW